MPLEKPENWDIEAASEIQEHHSRLLYKQQQCHGLVGTTRGRILNHTRNDTLYKVTNGLDQDKCHSGCDWQTMVLSKYLLPPGRVGMPINSVAEHHSHASRQPRLRKFDSSLSARTLTSGVYSHFVNRVWPSASAAPVPTVLAGVGPWARCCGSAGGSSSSLEPLLPSSLENSLKLTALTLG